MILTQALMSELRRNFEVISAQQQREIRRLTVQLKEQAARIEKVSAQIEVNKACGTPGRD